MPDNLKPSSDKYGMMTFYDDVNLYATGSCVLNSSGQLISPSGVTRTEFSFSITYVID